MKEGNAKDLLLEDALHAAIEAEREIIFYRRMNWILIFTVWFNIIMNIIQLNIR